MTKIARLSSTTALVTLMAAPTFADVSANNVWDVFTTYYHAVGLTVDATQTRAGNRLGISDLKLSADFPFELGSIVITTTGFDLIENSDGTVDIDFPDNLPLAMALSLPDNIFATATIDYRFTGYRAQASGDPDNITITSAMDSGVMKLGSLNISGAELPQFDLTANVTMRDFLGETTFASGDMITMTQDTSFGGMIVEGDFKLKDEDGIDMESRFNTAIAGMKTIGTLAVPAAGIDLLSLPAQLREGLSFSTTSVVANNSSEQLVFLDGQTVSEQYTAVENTTTTISFSKDGFSLASRSSNYSIDYLMPELPFPIKATVSKVAAELSMPLLKSDTEQGLTYLLELDGLVMDEGIWKLFDPESQLPRNPARFVLDMSGQAKLFYDLLDIDAMTRVFEDGLKFGELTAVTLNDMDITAIGARLTGSGAFTFDNNDLETFGGMPAPSGDARFDMAGLNGVLDTLVTIGLVENDAVFGMRMGLGLMTVAGDGDDTLVSDITVMPDGQIMANGQRIK